MVGHKRRYKNHYKIYVDGKEGKQTFKSYVPYVSAKKAFRLISQKLLVIECDFSIVNIETKHIYKYHGKIEKLEKPIEVTFKDGRQIKQIINYKIKRLR